LLGEPIVGVGRGWETRPLPGPAASADLVLVDGWILLRSDLEHLR
jgi:hypothetical protein